MSALEFPSLAFQRAQLLDVAAAAFSLPVSSFRVIFAPYRICPLGAHIDHQGGPVLGMTFNAGTLLAYAPTDAPRIALRSRNFPGTVEFSLHDTSPRHGSGWGDYLRCAVRALNDFHPLSSGFVGMTSGTLAGCGLSSSASVILAYLHALADVNNLQLAPWDFVRLAHRAENTYFGLHNGILDQTTITFGRRSHLVHVDTRNERADVIPQPSFDKKCRLLIAFSGVTRELIATGYNKRVQECREAASLLGARAGLATAQLLSHIPEDAFAAHHDALPPALRRRAQHYFSETRRVHEGLTAWRNADFATLGALMNASCRSSIELYEAGSPLIRELQDCVAATPGVFGARFNGGGFGGCVAAIVAREQAETAAEHILDAFRATHPSIRDRAAVFLADSADGVSRL